MSDIDKAIEYLARSVYDSPKSISWEALLFALHVQQKALQTLLSQRIGDEAVNSIIGEAEEDVSWIKKCLEYQLEYQLKQTDIDRKWRMDNR